MRADKKLFIISGVIISLFIAGLLFPSSNLIFGILLLPTVWMFHYRNIRAGWFWLLFLGTGTLIGLKAEFIILGILLENAFISFMVTSINFLALIFAIRRTFFVKGKNVKTVKQELEHELGTFTNNPATIKNKRKLLSKKIIVLTTLGFLFFVLAYFIYLNWSNKPLSNNLFSNKVKCETYAKELNQEFEQYNQELPYKDGDHSYSMKSLETIFYSPKLDTCLYSVHDYTFIPSTKYPCKASALSIEPDPNNPRDEATKRCEKERSDAERKLGQNDHIIYDVLTKTEVARFKVGADGQEKEYREFIEEHGGKLN